MTNNDLTLEVSDTHDLRIMRLFDTSFYHKDETVENYIIEVLPVNKTIWLPFYVAKNFSLVLNSSNLRYKKATDESCLIDLPDGIYEFKQSIKPNIKTVNHFYHLRITDLRRKLCSEKDDLFDNKCNLTREEFILNRDKLRDIEEYMYAAKWKVEECLDKVTGKELYQYAVKLLEQYTNECQC